MEQKIKFVLIGLIAVTVVSIFLYLSAIFSKQAILKERNELFNKNTSLGAQIAQFEKGLRDSESKVQYLSAELDKISKEKEELDKKYELAKKARDELSAKLKERPSVQQTVAPQEPVVPTTTDSYWAGLIKDKTDLGLQLESLRGDLKTVKMTNEQLQREKSALELELNNVRRSKDDLERQLEYNQKLVDSVAQELVMERNDKRKIKDSLSVLKSENESLVEQLKSFNSQKTKLENSLAQLEDEKSRLGVKLSSMDTLLKDKVSNIGELKDRLEVINSSTAVVSQALKEEQTQQARQEGSEFVELPPIVVRPQQQTEMPSLDSQTSIGMPLGSVLAVNKENNFVVIDLGEEAGLRMGDIFEVTRDGKAVAVVEVIQARRNIAACDIKRENFPIEIGDAIR